MFYGKSIVFEFHSQRVYYVGAYLFNVYILVVVFLGSLIFV